MDVESTNHQLSLIAKKKVEDIKGFYTHFLATFLILPFIIFINLKTVPQFHWFWYAIIAWCLGLVIHWINVFGFAKMSFKQDWHRSKVKELMGSDYVPKEDFAAPKYIKEQYYLKAKKQAKEIKGFYVHLFVNLFSLPIIIFINLKFVPSFHFFWFALGGMCIAIFFHWLGVFGFEFFGLGKKWEAKKIDQIIKKYK